MKKKPDAMIFDMDGTLWDAVGTYTKAWNVYFKENSIDYSVNKEYLDSLMGLEESAYLAKVIPQFTPDERKEIYQKVIELQYFMIDEEGGLLYNGVVEGMARLAEQYKLFIVSNCPKYTIKHFIKWAKIEKYISDTLAHGENYQPKYKNIGEIIARNNIVNPIYVGDTDSDRKQSEKAHVPFIFMEYGFGECCHYQHKFSSFTDFCDYYCMQVD